MPRPKLKSDTEVLDAAARVLKRRGPVDFTLKDVAQEVGLARATLIQRFVNRETLLQRLMARSLEQLQQALAEMPLQTGKAGLRAFLQTLIQGMAQDYSFAINVLIAWYEAQDPVLRTLAHQRNLLVQAAIQQRLPAQAPPETARLLHAIIAGACMQWVLSQEGTVQNYIQHQVLWALEQLLPD